MRRAHRRHTIISAAALSIVLCTAACVAALALPMGGVTASATVRVAIDPAPAKEAAPSKASAASIDTSAASIETSAACVEAPTQGRRLGRAGGLGVPAQSMPSSDSLHAGPRPADASRVSR